MSREREVKIVVEDKGSGKREIKLHDPATGRTIETGHVTHGEAHFEKELKQVKEQMERAGNHVVVKEV